MLNRRIAAMTALAVGIALFAAGCGSDSDSSSGGESITAVATTTQVADLVRQVGGDEVEVVQILQPNTDPHEYEPRPSDVEALADADLVFRSGGHLDEWTDQLVEDSGSSAEVVDLGSGLPVGLDGEEHSHDEEVHSEDEHSGEKHAGEGEKHAGEDGTHAGDEHSGEKGHSEGEHEGEHEGEEVDPHWWHDPVNAITATAAIESALVSAEPAAATTFENNAAAYTSELEALDRTIAQCFESIPDEQRKMVTDHDAFGYLANRYDINVVGTVIPALTTQAEPSAGDLADLEKTIKEQDVKAVFPESSVPSKLSEAVAADTGATTEYVLYGDTLGAEGSDGETYVQMMQANADNLMLGMTGGEKGCDFS